MFCNRKLAGLAVAGVGLPYLSSKVICYTFLNRLCTTKTVDVSNHERLMETCVPVLV
jgi:hypothetical protein